MRRTHQVVDGEPYVLLPRHTETCCDCGLVHRNSYRVLDRHGNPIHGALVEMRSVQAPRLTARERTRKGRT